MCSLLHTVDTAGVVIGVVVGIVVLSLSIAAAGMFEISSMLFYGCMMKSFPLVAISWYKLKSQRREEGSCSQVRRLVSVSVQMS